MRISFGRHCLLTQIFKLTLFRKIQLEKFWTSWSLLRISIQTFINNSSWSLAHMTRIWNSSFMKLFKNICHFNTLIQSSSSQTLIQNDSNRPYLSFFIIYTIFIRLRCHVTGRAHIILQIRFLIAFNLTIPKIDDLWVIVMHHNICWL